MEKYLRLFAALERIFGKGYVSRLMGKQSNVITLPDKQARKFLDTELNVMEASEGAVKKGIQDLETVISDTKRLSTLNDQELLTITNNAERLAVKVNPPAPPPAPTADVIPFTKKPKESGIKSLKQEERSIDDYVDDAGGVNKDDPRGLDDFFDKPEDFATGGRVGMAGGGILKLAMKFFNDNNPVSAYKKYLKYVKETAQKDPAKLAPEVGGIVVGSELIHRGLRRKLKEVKEKNNENDSENLETDSRVGYKKGGITALKSIIKFLAKNRGFGPTTGSKSLQELNPKQFGWKFNLLSPELKKSMEQNRLEYLENLSDAIKSDKKLLTDIKNMPKEWQEFMYKSANEGANQGRLDVYKKINIDDAISEIEQMKKNLEFKNLPGKEIKRRMNAEGGVSQGLDYLAGIERRGYAGGSILKTIGKKLIKKPKTETTSIDPIIDENVDLSKRGFLKGAAGVGAGIAAFGSGALKLAKKGAKEVKDLDVVFRKNYDGEYVDGTPTVFSEIIADIVPYTKKAKTFLEDMVKQKKVIKNNDGSYFVDVQDIHDMGGDIGVFKDIGNKFNYKTFKTDNYVDIEEIKDLRSYSSPLKNNPTYGPIDFEDDAAEYVADALQPKTAKEIIKERTDLIERKLKERGDFAGGGLGYLQGL
jgi:hypothetical protein